MSRYIFRKYILKSLAQYNVHIHPIDYTNTLETSKEELCYIELPVNRSELHYFETD